MRALDVPASAAGERLDRFLAAPLGSRAQAQRLIDAGQVLVDGTARPKRHRLAGGEHLEVDETDPRPAPERGEAPFAVAYEDEHLLVVDKPAGVVVHPARGHRTGTLAQALAGLASGGPDPWRAGIVHRIDRDTSGLLVVARSDEVHRALKAALSARRLEREYLALVHGRPPARSGTIDAPIGRDRRHPERVSTDTDVPREATTDFVVERALPHSTLLRVRLRTGRTHQIRVHLEAIGHPVVGDAVYAGRSPGETYGLERQFLHAARLAFDHPVTGARVDVRSPLPEDLVAALAQAERRGGPSAATPRSG
jgi:23S rRNA pseudouridine1911/1915/1917 synthase